jgi:hypothetical protein
MTCIVLLLLLLFLNPAVGGIIGFSLAYGGGSAVTWYEPKPGNIPGGIVPVSAN